jgi:hypothetical protein
MHFHLVPGLDTKTPSPKCNLTRRLELPDRVHLRPKRAPGIASTRCGRRHPPVGRHNREQECAGHAGDKEASKLSPDERRHGHSGHSMPLSWLQDSRRAERVSREKTVCQCCCPFRIRAFVAYATSTNVLGPRAAALSIWPTAHACGCTGRPPADWMRIIDHSSRP